MAISKKDKKDIAAMIARAVTAFTPAGVDSETVETAAQEPRQKIMYDVKSIQISTDLKQALPGGGTTTQVKLKGSIAHQPTTMYLDFPPGEATQLSELKRIQSYPHLLQQVTLYCKEDAATGLFMYRLAVPYSLPE